jgi:hypothetical protein
LLICPKKAGWQPAPQFNDQAKVNKVKKPRSQRSGVGAEFIDVLGLIAVTIIYRKIKARGSQPAGLIFIYSKLVRQLNCRTNEQGLFITR